MELIADLALARKPVGPVHDRSVAGAASMRGHLLGPLIRRAQCVRPADGIVVVHQQYTFDKSAIVGHLRPGSAGLLVQEVALLVPVPVVPE